MKKFFSVKELAARWHISTNTLKKWRLSGRGVGHPNTSPFGTHRALLRQWARDETIT